MTSQTGIDMRVVETTLQKVTAFDNLHKEAYRLAVEQEQENRTETWLQVRETISLDTIDETLGEVRTPVWALCGILGITTGAILEKVLFDLWEENLNEVAKSQLPAIWNLTMSTHEQIRGLGATGEEMFLAFAKSWTGTLEELVETVEDTVNNPVTVKETQAQ